MSDEKVPDYKAPLTKKATPLQARFSGWLQSDAVGYDPASAKSKREAFEEGVRLAVALRIPFQASDFNRQATLAEREERASAKESKTEEAPAKKAPAKKAPAKSAPATAEEASVAAPAPARKPAARRAPARRAATKASTPEDAPF